MVFWRRSKKRSNDEVNEESDIITDPQPSSGKETKGVDEDAVESEELRKMRMLEAQKQLEDDAARRNVHCKKQRVKYFYKAENQWFDAVVVGVHYDDGPDKPYYTINYWRDQVEQDEAGNKSVVRSKVEKQTTPDRLERVDFDEAETWKLLCQQK